MAVEPKRGCGYRKVGGLYVVGDPGSLLACDRLPFPLTVCPTCHAGIKPSRGWTWIFPYNLFEGNHTNCTCSPSCPICHPAKLGRKAGLLWIGKTFYEIDEFLAEAEILGVSRRIAAVPRGFRLGQTWVLVAHGQAVRIGREKGTIMEVYKKTAGIFSAFKPTRIEKIITESESRNEEEMLKLANRGITPIVVPDDDADHR